MYKRQAVSYMTENSLISGTDETTFGADAPVSRAEAIMVLYRMAGSADTEFKGVFSDVAEDAAYAKAVEWASANGIVSGYGDTTFAPDEEITKQDLISFLYRYAVYDDAYVTVDESADLKAFSDADKAADYASDALIWAADSGIVADVYKRQGQCLWTPYSLHPIGHKNKRQHIFCLLFVFQY